MGAIGFAKKKYLFLLFLLSWLITPYTIAASWQTLTKGLDYQDLAANYLTPWAHVHAFRINLAQHQLALVMAKDLGLNYASAQEYAHYSKAELTINGGFFDQNYQPLGLRISQKQQKSTLKPISWWGVFYIKDNKAYVASLNQFVKNSQMEFALQSGPRLLVNGKIPVLKAGRSERSALGIAKDGSLIILITDNNPLSTTELAQLFKDPPLNCWNALNLDGGSSSQLYAKIKSFRLLVYGFSKVADAIYLKKKSL